MKVLITHEESQIVLQAFLNAGHDAYSNDLLPCSGKYPERHLQMDCFEAIKLIQPDFLGMHPECTRLTVAANKWYLPEYAERFPNIHQEREAAVDHFKKCAEALRLVGKGYIENPIGIMSRLYKKPTQIIQPYQFGHTERKATCLWLVGLDKLVETNVVAPEIIYHKSGRTDGKLHFETMKLPKEERRKARSKTFVGIAEAMAEQWGGRLKKVEAKKQTTNWPEIKQKYLEHLIDSYDHSYLALFEWLEKNYSTITPPAADVEKYQQCPECFNSDKNCEWCGGEGLILIR